jgi:hypothetical protein
MAIPSPMLYKVGLGVTQDSKAMQGGRNRFWMSLVGPLGRPFGKLWRRTPQHR